MRGWLEKMSDDELEIIRNAGVVLLQREIPDSINIQVAKVRIKFFMFDSKDTSLDLDEAMLLWKRYSFWNWNVD